MLTMLKTKNFLPLILMMLFALSRWPGLMPWNFSAAYALMFCAGVYFPKRLVWWLPFATMLVADTALNWYHHTYYGTPMFSPELIGNYIAYAAIVWLGRKFGPKARFLSLLAGGVLGAILFYLITNTFSWFFNPFHNPEYVKTFAGWLTALTKGTAGYAQTWEFFQKTLTSGGLFTGLFAGAMKIMEALEPAEEKEEAEEPAEKPEHEPEKAEA
jgi:hypothetical protein